jgi:hypothetical protein
MLSTIMKPKHTVQVTTFRCMQKNSKINLRVIISFQYTLLEQNICLSNPICGNAHHTTYRIEGAMLQLEEGTLYLAFSCFSFRQNSIVSTNRNIGNCFNSISLFLYDKRDKMGKRGFCYHCSPSSSCSWTTIWLILVWLINCP